MKLRELGSEIHTLSSMLSELHKKEDNEVVNNMKANYEIKQVKEKYKV